ncbi:phosphatase PAP2 family protein [Deefgea piscis]|uniref:Phosphatase PAP2 family protein n=1 Tax=Deefgea piscis TaxID=2739061 RepID=A0A6M8SPX8_9NEIS|nr:phosphatase PAP2 family protein [Deefgea piscis]QKJ66218.1 phosphatase PAP2 family protein [Deefgea piscis]
MRSFSLRQHPRTQAVRRFQWLALAGMALLLLLILALEHPYLNALDLAMSQALYSGPVRLSQILAALMSFAGSLLLALVLAAYFWRSDRLAAIGLPLSVGACWALAAAIKYTVQRPRPEILHLAHASSPSFPSGHSMAAWTLSMGLAFIFAQRYPERQSLFYILALLFALVCGLSRVALGVHYFSDVLAGFAAATLIVAVFVMRYAKSRRDF